MRLYCSACTCYIAGLMGHCLEKHGWEVILKENEKTFVELHGNTNILPSEG